MSNRTSNVKSDKVFGGFVTEEGFYVGLANAKTMHVYPNNCGQAEVQVLDKSLSQVIGEDKMHQEISRKSISRTFWFCIIINVISMILAAMTKNIWSLLVVYSFWMFAYGCNKILSDNYITDLLASLKFSETKKYDYAFEQVYNYALKYNCIPTIAEAIRESPYGNIDKINRLGRLIDCIAISLADAIITIAIYWSVYLGWFCYGTPIILNILLTIAFIGFLIVMMKGNLLHEYVRKFLKPLRYTKLFRVLAERPFMKRAEYRHYKVAMKALEQVM